MKSKEGKKGEHMETPEDGVPESDEEDQGGLKEEAPKRRETKLKAEENMAEAIRRAIHLADL